MGIRLDELPVLFLRLFALWFGLIWGSFLNVVIYRVPREMSVVRPGSHCPGCGKPIAAWDNVPVLSYLILRGRARCCGTPMSPRYPVVELLGGALSMAVLDAVVLQMPGGTDAVRALAVYLADFALCLGLLAGAFIDVEHLFLPDSITLGGLVLGVATATLRGFTLRESIVGAVVGFLEIFLPLNVGYKLVRGRTGMGIGDAKLTALAGAWFGWPGAVFTLFGGAIQGSLYAIGLLVTGKRPELPQAAKEELEELRRAAAEGDEEAKKELEEEPLAEAEEGDGVLLAHVPFGPFLILAILELLLAWRFFEPWIEQTRDTFAFLWASLLGRP